MTKNTITLTGFINTKFGKEIAPGFFAAQLSTSFDNSAKDVEAKDWKYLNFKITSKINLLELDGKRVEVTGILSGDAFTPNGSDKEVVNPTIFIQKVRELAKGDKSDNSFEIQMRVNQFKQTAKSGEEFFTKSGSISFQKKVRGVSEMKYLNFDVRVTDGVQVTYPSVVIAKGFVTGRVYTNAKNKEVGVPIFQIMTATAVETSATTQASEAPAPSQEDSAPAPQAQPKVSTPAVDPGAINEDEIPF